MYTNRLSSTKTTLQVWKLLCSHHETLRREERHRWQWCSQVAWIHVCWPCGYCRVVIYTSCCLHPQVAHWRFLHCIQYFKSYIKNPEPVTNLMVITIRMLVATVLHLWWCYMRGNTHMHSLISYLLLATCMATRTVILFAISTSTIILLPCIFLYTSLDTV